MKLYLVLFFCSLLINQSLSKQLDSQKLIEPRIDLTKVGVYYESFDNDSITFISNQLVLSDALLNIINLDLVPWGRTQYNDSTFICKNGELECHGDRIHACAITLLPNTTKQLLQFVTCTVQHDQWKINPAAAGSYCADKVDGWLDEWTDIEVCALMNDTTDINIFLAMKNKTEELKPPLSKVPVITINGDQNTAAESNLKNAICGAISGEKPAGVCDTASEIISNKLLIITIALIATIFSFK